MELQAEELTFTPETHVYRHNGIIVPSVSAVIKRFFSPPGSKNGMELGTYVHDTIRLYLDDNLNMERLDPLLTGYLRQFHEFIMTTGFKIEGHDIPFYHAELRYAGTPDLWGILNDRRFVIDIKTGGIAKWHHLQVAAYALLLKAHGLEAEGAALLYLTADSHRLITLRPEELADASTMWPAMRRIYAWAEGQ